MKIILDTDGTVTNINKFLEKNAYKYFIKKYGMEIKFPNALEIEDIFDMKNFFMKKFNCDETKALHFQKKALNKFWISPKFFKYSLNKFRPGIGKFIKNRIKDGHTFEVHTSRIKTTDKNFVGFIARTFTILQYRLNGVFIKKEHFHFYKNDSDKLEGILKSNPDLVLDDKPEIIKTLNKNNIQTFCINGNHNKDVLNSKLNIKIYDFNENVDTIFNNLF
ncbi:MAG: hypothetical protein II309_03475 [Bacilli bacterium]|nr:hypothetical protein [Bacilli bacterium]